MDRIDFLSLIGLVVAVVAVIIAVYGILDVRDQVRKLVSLERDRSYARLLDALAWRFVNRAAEVEQNPTKAEMHEFAILNKFLDPTLTLEDAQEYAYNEALSLAQEYVKLGFAHWREDFDETLLRAEINKWQSERNSAVLNRMFGKYRALLSRPKKLL